MSEYNSRYNESRQRGTFSYGNDYFFVQHSSKNDLYNDSCSEKITKYVRWE